MNNPIVNVCLLSLPPLSAGQTKLGTTRNYNSCARPLDTVKPCYNDCIYIYIYVYIHTTTLMHRKEDHTTFLWIRDGWLSYDGRYVFVFIPLTMAYSKTLRKAGVKQSKQTSEFRWNLTSDTPYRRWSTFSMHVCVPIRMVRRNKYKV